MKQALQAAIKVKDRTVIELDNSIVKMANIRDGDLFTEEVTKEGILLKRLEDKQT